MSKRLFSKFTFFLFFILIFISKSAGLSYSELDSTLSSLFYNFVDEDEGQTSFRSLLIPFGGRTESLGSAYTGLSDDIGYLQFNPGAGSIQKQSQISLFHNMWIADSKMETLAFTTRFKNQPHFSLGGYASCFYLPFTEYNLFGDRVTSGYYSETFGAINLSYNILAGYDFKGLALGMTLKSGWRGMPDYTDNDSDRIIKGSGLEQSGLAIAGDIGFILQFNFLKYYYSRDPNVRIGFSAQNLGIGLTGFGKQIKIDDPLPTLFSAGISLRFIKPITLSADIQQPVNLFQMGTYLTPHLNSGISFQFTDFLAVLGGFSLKG